MTNGTKETTMARPAVRTSAIALTAAPPETDVVALVPGAEVRVNGPISVRTSAHVRGALSSAIDAGEGDFVLHLGSAEVWDATGLGVIVGAHHRATRSGRRFVVADVSPRLCRLMRATKLDRVVELHESVPSFVPLARTA